MTEARRDLEYRTLGRTGEKLSAIGFGGIIVMNQTPAESANYVAEAVDRGVNYFDVAPMYGNAEERLGPALMPHRNRVFLACKSHLRDGLEVRKHLEHSLRLLQTDHVDLYQLHALIEMEEVERAFGPGGALEEILKARQEGMLRYIGFSAHAHPAALAAMERFDFDTILFPFNFASCLEGDFGPQVLEAARRRGMGLLALKAMARQRWAEDLPVPQRPWPKCWYEPLDDPETAALALRFTLGLGVTAALPPGHWELFKLALDLAQAGELAEPLTEPELERLRALAGQSRVLFQNAAA